MIKKLLGLFLLTALFAIPAHAQLGNTTTIRFAGAPTGTCAPLSFGINNATGALYDCVAGTWTLVGSGGAASCPGGSNTQVLYNNAGVCGGIAGSVWSGTTLAFSHTATATGNGFIQILGDGLGSNLTLLDVVADDFNSYAQCWGNAQAVQRWCAYVNNSGGAESGWLVLTPLDFAGGLSVVSAIETTTFYGGAYRSSSATDPADSGLFRLDNAEAGLCAEANPTGTDSCLTYSASNAWTAGGLGITRTVFQGTKALATGAIASTACNVDTLAASGTLSTDTITGNFNANVDAVTGYVPATTGGLRITLYPTTDQINISVCNPTALSITPGAVTLNLAVRR